MKTPKGKEMWRNFCMTVRPTSFLPVDVASGLRLCRLTYARPCLVSWALPAVREHRARLQLRHAHPGRLHQGLRPGQHGARSVSPLCRRAKASTQPERLGPPSVICGDAADFCVDRNLAAPPPQFSARSSSRSKCVPTRLPSPAHRSPPAQLLISRLLPFGAPVRSPATSTA
jgi:hypothetical protein